CEPGLPQSWGPHEVHWHLMGRAARERLLDILPQAARFHLCARWQKQVTKILDSGIVAIGARTRVGMKFLSELLLAQDHPNLRPQQASEVELPSPSMRSVGFGRWRGWLRSERHWS